MEHIEKLSKLRACGHAIRFAQNFDSIEETLRNCNEGEYIFWLAGRIGVNKYKLIFAQSLCAEMIIRLMKDKRSKKAIRIAKEYGRGEISEKKLKKVAKSASKAAINVDIPTAEEAAAEAAAYIFAPAIHTNKYSVALSCSIVIEDISNAAVDAIVYAVADMNVGENIKKYIKKRTAQIARDVLFDEIVEKFKELE